MSVSFGFVVGFVAWFLVRYLLAGLYTVDQNERAVKTMLRPRRSGCGDRRRSTTRSPSTCAPDERERYTYPQVRVIPPGGPYFKWPWERVHKVSIATADRRTWPSTRRTRRPTSGGTDARGGHQGPAQHRPDRPDPLPRLASATSTPICSA